ncbi:MAG: hypothetical protein ACI4U9_02210 [Clostridia bacterium]
MSIYNNEFLNQYFTSEEFNFVNNINLEIEEINKNIEKEEKSRDIIVQFINNIKDDKNFQENNENFLGLLQNVEKVFELVNNNIKMLFDSQNVFNNISNEIINILTRN